MYHKFVNRHRTSHPYIFVLAISLYLLLVRNIDVSASPYNYVEIYIYGPVMAQIIDGKGHRAGRNFITGEILETVTGSQVTLERSKDRLPGMTIKLHDPVQDQYLVQVEATGKGSFVIDIDMVDSSGLMKNSHLYRRVRRGDFFEFILTYNEIQSEKSSLDEALGHLPN